MTTLSVLMPVFNERTTVDAAVGHVLEAELPVDAVELIVVDDGSTDGTRELLRAEELPATVRCIFHDANRGKGAAVRTALAAATGDYVAIMDADLEYDPREIGALLEPMLKGEADAVFGTRGFASHTSFGFWYVMGNKLVTLVANVLFNSYVSDIMTCHKAMPTATMRGLALRENGFAIEPEITARLLRSGVPIFEVPVTYRARTRDAGKKLRAVDGLRVIRALLRCRLA